MHLLSSLKCIMSFSSAINQMFLFSLDNLYWKHQFQVRNSHVSTFYTYSTSTHSAPYCPSTSMYVSHISYYNFVNLVIICYQSSSHLFRSILSMWCSALSIWLHLLDFQIWYFIPAFIHKTINAYIWQYCPDF